MLGGGDSLELLESLERLYLTEDGLMDGRNFLAVERLSKTDKVSLEDLVEQGYLAETEQAGRVFYLMGEAGLAFLKQNDVLWNALAEKKEKKLRVRLRDFLEIVYEKDGQKVLSKTERKNYAQQLEQALREEKITEEANPHRYSLTLSGEAFLFSLRPPEEILKRLENSFFLLEAEVTEAQEAHQGFVQEFSQEAPALSNFIEERFTEIHKHVGLAVSRLEEVRNYVDSLSITREAKEDTWDKIEQIKREFQGKERDLVDEVEVRQKELMKQHAELMEEKHKEILAENSLLEEKLELVTKFHRSLISHLMSNQPLELENEQEDEEDNDDESSENDDFDLLEEIHSYYELTQFQHRGQLKLGQLLDHIVENFDYEREQLKQEILHHKNQGDFVLKKTLEFGMLEEKDIIQEDTHVYFALNIPELGNF